jgi:hypothetical protein
VRQLVDLAAHLAAPFAQLLESALLDFDPDWRHRIPREIGQVPKRRLHRPQLRIGGPTSGWPNFAGQC